MLSQRSCHHHWWAWPWPEMGRSWSHWHWLSWMWGKLVMASQKSHSCSPHPVPKSGHAKLIQPHSHKNNIQPSQLPPINIRFQHHTKKNLSAGEGGGEKNSKIRKYCLLCYHLSYSFVPCNLFHLHHQYTIWETPESASSSGGVIVLSNTTAQ